jgi:hypothetical protein
MPCPPNLLGDIAQELLDCLTVTLFDCGRPACRYFLSQGEVAWDECCDCGTGNGQAWVSLQGITPIISGPQATFCAWEYEATFAVGTLRCAAVLNADGSAPAADVLTAEAKAVMLDAALQRKAIVCCFGENKDPGDFLIGAWAPLGPAGACVGGATTVTVRFSGCDC